MTHDRRDVLKMMATAALLPLVNSIPSFASESTGRSDAASRSVVLNGAVALAFGPDKLYAFAPDVKVPHHPSEHDHYYRFDCTDWQGVANELVGPTGNSTKRSPGQYGLSESNAIIIDCKKYGFTASAPKYVAILLPYPDNIYPLRLLDLTFTRFLQSDVTFNGAAGAWILEYASVPMPPNISGSSWQPSSGYPWMLYINVGPHEDTDPNFTHTIRAWKGIKQYFPKLNWKFRTGSKTSSSPMPTPSGITDDDIEQFECRKPGLDMTTKPANCKLGAPLVLNMP